MIEVITERYKLDPLESEWNALAGLHNNPLLYFDWFMSCAETIHSEEKLCIVIVRDRTGVVAIAPLYVSKRNVVETLELMGTSDLYEPSGFLYKDYASLVLLMGAIHALGVPAVLTRLPSDRFYWKACGEAGAWRKAINFRRPAASSAFLSLPQDWSALWGRLSKSRRYEYRRKRNCLEKSGNVAIRILSPGLSEFAPLLKDAMQVENRNWKGQRGSSLLGRPRLRAFFEVYLQRACRSGIVRFFFIDVDGVPVSMHVAIESNKALWILKLGYDASMAKCSPGTQLAMDTIEYSVRKGLARYEFLGSKEAWQHAWPIETHSYFTLYLFPFSLRGLLGFFGLGMMYATNQVRGLLQKRKMHETPCA